jgi:hypothetical protein
MLLFCTRKSLLGWHPSEQQIKSSYPPLELSPLSTYCFHSSLYIAGEHHGAYYASNTMTPLPPSCPHYFLGRAKLPDGEGGDIEH